LCRDRRGWRRLDVNRQVAQRQHEGSNDGQDNRPNRRQTDKSWSLADWFQFLTIAAPRIT